MVQGRRQWRFRLTMKRNDSNFTKLTKPRDILIALVKSIIFCIHLSLRGKNTHLLRLEQSPKRHRGHQIDYVPTQSQRCDDTYESEALGPSS